MLFSQRYGFKPLKTLIQIDSMDDDLRSCLWNALDVHYWESIRLHLSSNAPMLSLVRQLWHSYFKKPVDTIHDWWPSTQKEIREYFFGCGWNEVYDFVEFAANNYPEKSKNTQFMKACNSILERELSAYRFIDSRIAPITSEVEVQEIDDALHSSPKLVANHLKAAFDRFADRKAPDYRNSMKEAIHAVEAMCRLIAKKDSATLAEALRELEIKATIQLHPSLKAAFDKLYGYTSDAEGIRHALLDEPTLDSEDAKFMLVSCSAFINYLKTKASKAGLNLSDL